MLLKEVSVSLPRPELDWKGDRYKPRCQSLSKKRCFVLFLKQVEFEWLRQFWFQGKRYRRCTDWWDKPMADLEELWRRMELMVCSSQGLRLLGLCPGLLFTVASKWLNGPPLATCPPIRPKAQPWNSAAPKLILPFFLPFRIRGEIVSWSFFERTIAVIQNH